MNPLLNQPSTPISFDFIITLMWIALFLVVGMLLRANVPFFKRYLIPACIIGGMTGFLFQTTGLISSTPIPLNNNHLQLLLYHLFNLTWVYQGLRKPPPKNEKSNSTTKLVLAYGLTAMTLGPLQYIIGVLCSTGTNFLGLSNGPDSLGWLTAAGFFLGPGQAFTTATIWERGSDYTGLINFAVTSAAMGYLVAIVVGIVCMNIIAKRKKIEVISNPSAEEECGYYDDCYAMNEAGKVTTSPSSIDVFAWHIAIGLLCYGGMLVFSLAILSVLPPRARLYYWGLFFLLCLIPAILVRKLLDKTGKGNLLCNGVTTRISNTLVDFLVCATFISIQVSSIVQYLYPFILACTSITILTVVFFWIYCGKLKSDGPEFFAFAFGNYTGTISTSFVLLRMIDPDGRSAIPTSAALGTLLVTPIMMSGLIISHLEVLQGFPVWVMIGLQGAIGLLGFILLWRVKIPMNKKLWQPD